MIFSHLKIEENELNRENKLLLDTGEELTYTVNYNKDLIINMPFIGQGNKGINPAGWKRDNKYYFKELLIKHPEFFSELNIDAIKDNLAPLCDATFIKFFPEFEGCYGILVHHHIGRDGQAVALPAELHPGSGGVHNVENKLGITENGILFSEKIQRDFENGEIFDWGNAWAIMEHVVAEKKEVIIPKNNDIDNSKNKLSKNGNETLDDKVNNPIYMEETSKEKKLKPEKSFARTTKKLNIKLGVIGWKLLGFAGKAAMFYFEQYNENKQIDKAEKYIREKNEDDEANHNRTTVFNDSSSISDVGKMDYENIPSNKEHVDSIKLNFDNSKFKEKSSAKERGYDTKNSENERRPVLEDIILGGDENEIKKTRSNLLFQKNRNNNKKDIYSGDLDYYDKLNKKRLNDLNNIE